MLCGCFTFPGRWPSGRTKQRPHSQWRDRAGFAPDFPVMPIVGTQTRSALYHDRVDAANRWNAIESRHLACGPMSVGRCVPTRHIGRTMDPLVFRTLIVNRRPSANVAR